MSRYERDPRFTDGAPVVSDDGEQGRVVGFDSLDGEYLVFPLPLGNLTETQWWNPREMTFDIDPNPQPWPGEDATPSGVFVLHRQHGIELFATIGDLVNADGLSDNEAEAIATVALQCVADPGEAAQVGVLAISFHVVEGSSK